MKKNLILNILVFLYSTTIFAQTYCLGFGLAPVSAGVVDINLSIIQASPAFKLGGGNLRFRYNTLVLQNPRFQASLLGAGYRNVTVSSFNSNTASFNFDITTPNMGTNITSSLAVGVIRFDIVPGNTAPTTSFTAVEGEVVIDDESAAISLRGDCAVANLSLPLDLLDFQVKTKGISPLLSWLTASEVNVEGFNIERSAEGKNFEKVGFVKSAGTSRGTYTFTDEVPLSGVNYYRLKMMNTDGSFTYSPVRSVVLAESKTTGLSVSPNPAKDAVFVKLNAKEAKTMTLELVDIAGKVLLTEKKKVEVGFNQLNLNLSGYPAGLYFLKVEGVAHRVVVTE